MPFPLEYPISMKLPAQRSIPTTLALVGFLFLLVSLSSAQHESASASAGSSSSGHSSSVSTPSAMSPAHTGYSPSSASGLTSSNHSHSSNGPAGNGPIGNHSHPHHHSWSSGDVYYPYVYLVPFPYTAEVTDTSNDADDDDDEYQGGPTIFDRRGSGAASYVAPTYEGPAHAAQDAPTEPEPPQPPTTLVFKNGNQLEIENYAIVSQTLYDLTPSHPRKIALADLDLAATEKQNDDRGVTFQLPPQAN
jgi:hypothetical protein